MSPASSPSKRQHTSIITHIHHNHHCHHHCQVFYTVLPTPRSAEVNFLRPLSDPQASVQSQPAAESKRIDPTRTYSNESATTRVVAPLVPLGEARSVAAPLPRSLSLLLLSLTRRATVSKNSNKNRGAKNPVVRSANSHDFSDAVEVEESCFPK